MNGRSFIHQRKKKWTINTETLRENNNMFKSIQENVPKKKKSKEKIMR